MLDINIKREIKLYRRLCNGRLMTKKESINTYHCWREIQLKRMEGLKINELEELIKWLSLKEDNISYDNKERDTFLFPLLIGVIISLLSFYFFPIANLYSNIVNTFVFVITLSFLLLFEHLLAKLVGKKAEYERRFYRDYLAIAEEVKKRIENKDLYDESE